MVNWFIRSQIMEKFAQAPPYGRVRAKDYLQLMREIDQRMVGFPATSSMNMLLNRMVGDLESAVMNVYWNTRAMGHTAHGYAWPCPDCNGIKRTIDDELDDLVLMRHYDSPEAYRDDWGDYDEGELPPMLAELFEKDTYGDGLFICEQCNKHMTFDQVSDEMKNPFPGGRELLISDQIDYVIDYLMKIKNGSTFEEKFPYFEGIIEWCHRSGDMSHWFIEGGDSTIDKYRSSKLPSRHTEDKYEDWVHPSQRDKDWDWSKI
jgi:hypothetical protein